MSKFSKPPKPCPKNALALRRQREKNRRSNIVDQINRLADVLPGGNSIRNKPQGEILSLAYDYIQRLKGENEILKSLCEKRNIHLSESDVETGRELSTLRSLCEEYAGILDAAGISRRPINILDESVPSTSQSIRNPRTIILPKKLIEKPILSAEELTESINDENNDNISLKVHPVLTIPEDNDDEISLNNPEKKAETTEKESNTTENKIASPPPPTVTYPPPIVICPPSNVVNNYYVFNQLEYGGGKKRKRVWQDERRSTLLPTPILPQPAISSASVNTDSKESETTTVLVSIPDTETVDCFQDKYSEQNCPPEETMENGLKEKNVAEKATNNTIKTPTEKELESSKSVSLRVEDLLNQPITSQGIISSESSNVKNNDPVDMKKTYANTPIPTSTKETISIPVISSNVVSSGQNSEMKTISRHQNSTFQSLKPDYPLPPSTSSTNTTSTLSSKAVVSSTIEAKNKIVQSSCHIPPKTVSTKQPVSVSSTLQQSMPTKSSSSDLHLNPKRSLWSEYLPTFNAPASFPATTNATIATITTTSVPIHTTSCNTINSSGSHNMNKKTNDFHHFQHKNLSNPATTSQKTSHSISTTSSTVCSDTIPSSSSFSVGEFLRLESFTSSSGSSQSQSKGYGDRSTTQPLYSTVTAPSTAHKKSYPLSSLAKSSTSTTPQKNKTGRQQMSSSNSKQSSQSSFPQSKPSKERQQQHPAILHHYPNTGQKAQSMPNSYNQYYSTGSVPVQHLDDQRETVNLSNSIFDLNSVDNNYYWNPNAYPSYSGQAGSNQGYTTYSSSWYQQQGTGSNRLWGPHPYGVPYPQDSTYTLYWNQNDNTGSQSSSSSSAQQRTYPYNSQTSEEGGSSGMFSFQLKSSGSAGGGGRGSGEGNNTSRHSHSQHRSKMQQTSGGTFHIANMLPEVSVIPTSGSGRMANSRRSQQQQQPSASSRNEDASTMSDSNYVQSSHTSYAPIYSQEYTGTSSSYYTPNYEKQKSENFGGISRQLVPPPPPYSGGEDGKKSGDSGNENNPSGFMPNFNFGN